MPPPIISPEAHAPPARDSVGQQSAAATNAAAARKAADVPATESKLQAGFLSRGMLYPDGSTEGVRAGWRGIHGGSSKNVFQLIESPSAYEVRGSFREAGSFLGKEDFAVTRKGRTLRIRGDPEAGPQSLVRDLDEAIELPLDAEWDRMSAEYAEFALTIRVPRNAELRELLSRLTVDELEGTAERLQPNAQSSQVAEAEAERPGVMACGSG